jgi:hypothetical protein
MLSPSIIARARKFGRGNLSAGIEIAVKRAR